MLLHRGPRLLGPKPVRILFSPDVRAPIRAFLSFQEARLESLEAEIEQKESREEPSEE